MRRIDTRQDLEDGLAHLLAVDARLVRVARIAGDVPLRRRAGGFGGLARIVVGQQLSVAAAASIWEKFRRAYPRVNAARIAAADEAALRSVGLSAPKIRTLKALSAACEGGLKLGRLGGMPAQEARESLTAVSGIGPWTADIYLMFCLGHPDIFPVGDLALRNAVTEAFGLEADAASAEAISLEAAAWSPWRTVAATLFWAYYGATRRREGQPA